ncbi:MAG: ABC transporter ATP-binding protein [Alphaproteobacteria bacterium]|nr:ABC transporter ATP-binding protein [Alphaproteobacteria bacterium]
MAEPLLKVEGLNKSFGGILATDNLFLDVLPGEIHAVIGPNGAGKTTMIAQLTGALKTDSGKIIFDGRNITREPSHVRSHLGLARSFQITSVFLDMTNLDNTALAVQAHDGHSFRFWRPARRDPALREPALRALERVGLDHRADVVAANCSHGEHRQLEIAMALATKPRMLLLDEPMAGMGPEESAQMVEIIRGLKDEHSILLVEHDMDAVFSLADRITVLVYGRAIASGAPDEIRANPDVREAYLGEETAAAPDAPTPEGADSRARG